jgi:hypothetical protein
MGTLFAFSLAKRKGGEDSFSIHTMIQTCTRERLSKLDKQKFAEKAVLVVAGAVLKMTLGSQSNWITSRQLLSHVTSCKKHLGHPLQNNELFRSTRAFFTLGKFCHHLSRHDQAITGSAKSSIVFSIYHCCRVLKLATVFLQPCSLKGSCGRL